VHRSACGEANADQSGSPLDEPLSPCRAPRWLGAARPAVKAGTLDYLQAGSDEPRPAAQCGDAAEEVSATAITHEPEGGSTTPTMPILFVGKHATE
jgi:hypothetical protein